MSIDLSHFIIHGLKTTDDEQFLPIFQADELPLTEAAEFLLEQLHHKFNAKPSKGVGRFQENSEFENSVKNWLARAETFVQFTQQTTQTIAANMDKYGLANDCYMLFADYKYFGQQFLLIAEMPIKEKITCSAELELSRFRFLDAEAMLLAARIDVVGFKVEPDSNYAAFIKGKAGRKISDFFLESLAIEETIDRKAQAEQLSQAVNEYCQNHVTEPDVEKALKKDVVSFCKEQQVAGEPVRLKELADVMEANSDVSFLDFISNTEMSLPEKLEPEVKTMQRLTKYSGTGKGVSISFDAGLLGDRIIYDVQNDKLTISEIPPNLKEQLLKILK